MVFIEQMIGKLKKYQIWICVLMFINKFGAGFHQMAIIFLAPPVSYKCPITTETCCKDPIFDRTVYSNTMTMQWNLICGRAWLNNFSQMLFQFGVLLGSLVFGMLSDRYGRRPTLIVAVVLQLFSGIVASILPDYWSFTIMRMLLGAAVGGILVIGFVIVMEYVGNTYRDIISALYHLPFTVGHMTLPLFGYYIRDYAYFQLAISAFNIFLLIYICLLPESLRWLLANNHTIEAIELTTSIAKCNNMPYEDITSKITMYQREHRNVDTGTIIDLFRTPNLRRNIIIMCFLWLVSCMCYYGEAQYISYFTGDIFINVMASGSVCFAGVLLAIPLMRFTKRKTAVIVSSIGSGLTLTFTAFIPDGKASVVLSCLGVMFCFMTFIILYLFTSELFPTVVRNGAVGLASMMGRLGSMIAPFIVSLKWHGDWCAPLLFGLCIFVSAAACTFLPETKNVELMVTLEEGETLGRRVADTAVEENDIT